MTCSGHKNNCRTTAAGVTQRRRYAAVPPKGVRLPQRFLCAGADRRTTGAEGGS
jgi:hypothetical protein